MAEGRTDRFSLRDYGVIFVIFDFGGLSYVDLRPRLDLVRTSFRLRAGSASLYHV